MFFGVSFWGLKKYGLPELDRIQINNQLAKIPEVKRRVPTPALPVEPIQPTPTLPPVSIASQPELATQTQPADSPSKAPAKTQEFHFNPDWKKKQFRGIYLSRYQITNRASEQIIRDRVRYYKSQGINTLIHGVWGNACTMYHSEVMQKTLGYNSCPNKFRSQWLNWLIDEANKQGMEAHAYFEI